MKKLLLFAICITMLTDASSQQSTFDLILNGVIVYIKPEELKKIKVVYYTVNNEKFSGKRSVKVTDGKCKFQLSKTKYAKVTTGDLVFAIDTMQAQDDQCAEITAIHLESLYAHAKASGQKVLTFSPNLHFQGCEISDMEVIDRPHAINGEYNAASGDTAMALTVDMSLDYTYCRFHIEKTKLRFSISSHLQLAETDSIGGQLILSCYHRWYDDFGFSESITEEHIYLYSIADGAVTIATRNGMVYTKMKE